MALFISVTMINTLEPVFEAYASLRQVRSWPHNIQAVPCRWVQQSGEDQSRSVLRERVDPLPQWRSGDANKAGQS